MEKLLKKKKKKSNAVRHDPLQSKDECQRLVDFRAINAAAKVNV